ncbi:MAG: cell division protein FtsA, partial [Candidatus Cloacimonetes bacterium]|nr:cell division protein FtsA [Candidatus Cloacimonadota bacterium]
MRNQVYTSLDIGTSFVKAIVARVANDGRFEIKGVSQIPSSGIDSGTVKDIQALSVCIRSALTEAENMADISIQNIFANITGETIKTQAEEGRIPIPKTDVNEPGEILEDQVEAVKNQARDILKIRKGFERSQILHSIAQSYSIDGTEDIFNPLNMNGFQLSAKVYHILSEITSIRNLSKAIELAGYQIDPNNFVLNHVALDHALLSDDEKRLGCIVIDIGGGTCDVSLYNNGILRHVFVIPMAGAAVTRDLAIGLKTTISNAESLKTQYGSANSTKV